MRKRTGVIITLAYPEEFVAMVPGWYRKPLEWIGIVNKGMICAGHSAMVLIDKTTGFLEYADFGRYIAPVGKGRARTFLTDPEVEFDILAEFDEDGKVTNTIDLLNYIEAHPEKTHGGGTMFASFAYEVDYDATKAFISDLNLKGSVPYDPFKEGSSNCSRFVYDAIQAGLSSPSMKRRHYWGNRFTPSPLGNVFFCANRPDIYVSDKGEWKKYSGNRLKEIARHFFLKPESREKKSAFKEKPLDHAQWLGGIGAGAWFVLDQLDADKEHYRIRRYFKDGTLIFDRIFEAEIRGFDPNQKFQFAYDCHALECNTLQNGTKYTFRYIES